MCPGCPHFGHRGLPDQAKRRLTALARASGSREVRFGPESGFGYRHRVRLPVRKGRGGPLIGIFQSGTHHLIHIPDCPLHHSSIIEVTQELLRLCTELGIEAYDEGSHRGLLRTVQMVVQRSTGEVQVTLVLCVPADRSSQELELAERLARGLAAHSLTHSVFFNFQPEITNTLLGSSFRHLYGPPVIRDRSGGAEVFYPPGAFGQANPGAHDAAVQRIHSWVAEGPVVEYYAGVGTIGLGLARRGHPVVFNEAGQESVRGLAMGIAALPDASRCRVLAGPAQDHVEVLRERKSRATVIVDPPRKGLDRGLLGALVSDPPAQFIYLSCGLSSLERDSAELLRAGYRIIEIEGLAYFPFTEHIETLARFAPP